MQRSPNPFFIPMAKSIVPHEDDPELEAEYREIAQIVIDMHLWRNTPKQIPSAELPNH